MSYERNKIISLIYRIFQAENSRLFLDKQMQKTTYSDIEKIVEELEEKAYEIKGSCESGRIKVAWNKSANMYEYYLNLGLA